MLVAAFSGDELGWGERLFGAALIVLERFGEGREGKMPSPARKMRALPRVIEPTLIRMQTRTEWR